LFILLTEFYDRTATRTINGRFPANSWVVGAPTVYVVPASIRTGIPSIVVGLPTVAGFPIFVCNVLDLAGIPILLQETLQLMLLLLESLWSLCILLRLLGERVVAGGTGLLTLYCGFTTGRGLKTVITCGFGGTERPHCSFKKIVRV
jgi:hypothetical protein